MRAKLQFLEIGIFSVVCLVLLNSASELFRGHKRPEPGPGLVPELRSPASVTSTTSLPSRDPAKGRNSATKTSVNSERAAYARPVENVGAAYARSSTNDAVNGHSPAASRPFSGVIPYETKCSLEGEKLETSASKVRITGPFCGATPQRQVATNSSNGTNGNEPSQRQPVDTRIENITSHYLATVFTEQDTGKFSTDFIPLQSGENLIKMEFKHKNGKTLPIDLMILKK